MWHPPEVEIENVGCPLGCPPADEQILVARDVRLGLPGSYPVVRCTVCGLIRTNPRPTLDTIGFYYPEDYDSYEAPARVTPQPSGLRRAADRVVRPGTRRIPDLPPGRLLELGCASGRYLDEMVRAGWDVTGIEPSPLAAERARSAGHRVIAAPLERAPDLGGVYDLIVGWMVVEHLHDPVGVLRGLRDHLAPGGWLAFSVPNAASVEFRVFGEHWRALEVPRHLVHFTPATVRLMLKVAGWETVAVHHQRTLSNLVASVGLVLRDRDRFPRLSRWCLTYERGGRRHYPVYPLAVLAAAFGQTGRMTVWARRGP